MFGYNTLPIADADVSEIVSTVFLIGATLYNTWKNRNVSSASQTGQKVVDAIKSGELLVEEVDELYKYINYANMFEEYKSTCKLLSDLESEYTIYNDS